MRSSRSLGHEEIKLELDDSGRILRIGKDIDPERAAGESVGIEKFSAATASRLFEILDRRKVHNEFYEASFQDMIDGGCAVYAVDSGAYGCMEIDTPEDLAAAQKLAPSADVMTSPRPYSYSASTKSAVSDELINTYAIRPMAGLIVRLFYYTPLTPNGVTALSILAGCCAAFLYTKGVPEYTLIAGLCLTLKDVLDAADGQLARAKQLFSRKGRFFDSDGDFLVDLLVFAAIGRALVRCHRSAEFALAALLGFLGTTLRVSYHVFYQTSYLHLKGSYRSTASPRT